MPANPWDNSSILLSNTAGQSIGAGISAAGQSISRGIQEYRLKQKEKEAEDAAASYIKKKGKDLGLPINVDDDGEIKAAIKAAGGGGAAVQMLSGLAQQKQQADAAKQQQDLVAKHIAEFDRQNGERLRRSGAAQLATGGTPGTAETGAMIQGGANFADLTPNDAGTDGDAVVQKYLQRSGDVKGGADLADAYQRLALLKQKETQFTPTLVDLGDGRKGMTTSRSSAVPLTDPKAGAAAAMPFEVNGKKFTKVGEHVFKEDGTPVNFAADRPPVAPPFELQSTDPELYSAMRSQYLEFTNRNATSAAAVPKASAQDQKALSWARANPKDPRAQKIFSRLGVAK